MLNTILQITLYYIFTYTHKHRRKFVQRAVVKNKCIYKEQARDLSHCSNK